MLKLIDVIQSHDVLGEGPVWDGLGQRLIWTDIQSRVLKMWAPGAYGYRVLPAPERVCSYALLEGDTDRLLVAFESGFGFWDLRTGQINWLSRPELGATGRRFNDGRTDRQGRFWVGSMVEDDSLAPPASAALWRIDADGAASIHHSGVSISNGLTTSLDGKTLYFADSPQQKYFAFDLEPETGVLSGQREFVNVAHGYPDGSAIDSEGCVWNARWGAGQVVRHAPSGDVIMTVDIPASQPTCVAFGGPDLKTLFVTSATDGLRSDQLAAEPQAGSVFVFEATVAGVPEVRFESKMS